MKAVLWSIQRPHTDNLKSGQKLDEIRTKIPKDLPADIWHYIYESKKGGGCGKVIGRFKVKDKTYIYYEKDNDGKEHLYNTAFVKACLTFAELAKYLNRKNSQDGWALRVSELEIFDTPMKLSDFYTTCTNKDPFICATKCRLDSYNHCYYDKKKPLTRPPQSWQYVEVQNGH